MRILDFFWPYDTADQTTLADEAVSAVGIHAGRRIESIVHLREMEKRLHANIRREMDALKAVQAAIEREEVADAAIVVEAAGGAIETVLEDMEFSLIDCTATTVGPVTPVRSVATEPPAKRKRKLTEITSEAA